MVNWRVEEGRLVATVGDRTAVIRLEDDQGRVDLFLCELQRSLMQSVASLDGAKLIAEAFLEGKSST